jgi:hypothetical protein
MNTNNYNTLSVGILQDCINRLNRLKQRPKVYVSEAHPKGKITRIDTSELPDSHLDPRVKAILDDRYGKQNESPISYTCHPDDADVLNKLLDEEYGNTQE